MTPAPTRSPEIITRAPQPFVAIGGTVPMTGIAAVADRFPDLFAWLGARGLADAGPPFLRYDLFTPSGLMVLTAGVPVAEVVATEPGGPGPTVTSGVLPGGRFVRLTHRGHPSGLREVTADLLDWGSDNDLLWDMSESDAGQHWGLRLELYKTDPAIEPDLHRWETDLVFRLADR